MQEEEDAERAQLTVGGGMVHGGHLHASKCGCERSAMGLEKQLQPQTIQIMRNQDNSKDIGYFPS